MKKQNPPQHVIQHVPIRYAYYVSAVALWKKILASFPLTASTSIVELCPGWTPKLSLACAQLKFTGNYFAVDSSPQALVAYEQLLSHFCYDFHFRPVVKNIVDGDLPRADMLLLNHVLDDLLLFEFLVREKKSPELAFAHPDKLIGTWQDVAQVFSQLRDGVMNQLKEQLLTSLNHKGVLIISQYPGYQEKLYGNTLATQLAEQLFDELKIWIDLEPRLQTLSADPRWWSTTKQSAPFQITEVLIAQKI